MLWIRLSDWCCKFVLVQFKWRLGIAAVTNTSAESWINMQIKLDLWKARQQKLGSLKEFPKLAVQNYTLDLSGPEISKQ